MPISPCQSMSIDHAGTTRGMPAQWLFCYGTLMLEEIFSLVSGIAKPLSMNATLPGFERRTLSARPYPGIRRQPGGAVEGVLYQLPKLVLPALDRYEGDMYLREAVTVSTDEGDKTAWCYVLRPRYCHLMLKTDWDLQCFRGKHLADYLQQLRQERAAPR
jgi:gamma-glutamylcyclotransferase (GGCT)/AIG2-like uncharacterized protein YtfP